MQTAIIGALAFVAGYVSSFLILALARAVAIYRRSRNSPSGYPAGPRVSRAERRRRARLIARVLSRGPRVP